MIHSSKHFQNAIQSEALRLMDEEPLTLDEAFVKARKEFAGMPCCEPPDHRDNPALATPCDTD